MFTGIIECLGTIISMQEQGSSVVLSIRPDMAEYPVAIGGSVAINGACLTLERTDSGNLRFSAVAETLKRTSLAAAKSGTRVNLERAMPANGRLDGHFVYGHVDSTASIISDNEVGGSLLRTISLPPEMAPYCAEKGSVAVDGISLTISRCSTAAFEISFIPHTLACTTMSLKKPGDLVNLEADIIARYMGRLLSVTSEKSAATPKESLLSIMERSGF